MEYLILASILLAPPTVVWSAAETTAGWSGRPALIDDARFGAHAVRYTLAADSKTEPTFDFGPTGQPPTAEHLATFWYRVSGEGRVSLAFKLICDFTEGWQGTWLIDPTSPADGRWRKAVVDLGTPWLRWGEAPLPDRTLAVFRLQTDSRSAVTVDIDQLQLEPRRFQAAALGSRVVDGQPRARVRLTNLPAEALALEVAGTRVDLPASAQRVVEVPLAELAPT
ncbi:MAG TPA: hypothetical protein DCZ72_07015 [Armatimonadetes bacterium]|nr:hypothetical protein [Armatimonadota bacterium]